MNRVCGAAVVAALLLAQAAGAAVMPTIGGDLGAQSKYVWRGAAFNTEPVLWPDVWSSWNGFTLTAFASMDLTDVKQEAFQVTDFDLFLEYARAFGPVTGTLGYAQYIYPGYAGAYPATGEVYVKGKVDLKVLQAGVAANLDVIHVKGLYVSPSLSRSLTLGPVTGTLAVSLGWGTEKHNEYYYAADKSALTDLTGGLNVAWTPPGCCGKFMTVTANLGYAQLLGVYTEGTKSNVWGGLTFNFFYTPGSK
jgi:hypothetical protein